MSTWRNETIKIARVRAKDIEKQFIAEVKRLTTTGAVTDDTSRALIFGVAVENIADGFLFGDRKTASYRNLRHF